MADAQPAPAGGPLPRGHLLALNRSFRRTLEAENKRPRTVEAYTDAVRFLALYCEAHGHPIHAAHTSRTSSPTSSPAGSRPPPTTATGGLHAFFKWAVAEGDLQSSPMDGMRPPRLPEYPVGVVRAEQLPRLLKSCEGRDFTSRRHTAIILLLVDTGMRRAECVGMTLDDVDLDQRIVWGAGQGPPAAGAADRPQADAHGPGKARRVSSHGRRSTAIIRWAGSPPGGASGTA